MLQPLINSPDNYNDHHAIKKTGRSSVKIAVTVGRTLTNDLVINDDSISKIHGYFIVTSAGTVSVIDAGSSNGTFVGDQAVPSQGKGNPIELNSRTRVRLGRIAFTFLDCADFREMVRNVVG